MTQRRQFIRTSAIGTLAFQIAGTTVWLTPSEARAKQVALKHFDASQAELLVSFCEHLLPGAKDAGVLEFIDHQLGETPNECLLMCKYFPGINAPYQNFYHGGLSALADFCQSTFNQRFMTLADSEKNSVVDQLWSGEVEGWAGPPPPVFYMMLRSDAVDVVYGTEAGFKQLDVPYLAHIRPPHNWNGEVS